MIIIITGLVGEGVREGVGAEAGRHSPDYHHSCLYDYHYYQYDYYY